MEQQQDLERRVAELEEAAESLSERLAALESRDELGDDIECRLQRLESLAGLRINRRRAPQLFGLSRSD
jgi:hypothetical protein